MDIKEFKEGYIAENFSDNPYWINYPAKVPNEERVRASVWIDGLVQRIIDQHSVLAEQQRQ